MPEVIALREDLHVQARTPFLERIEGKLQERARAIMDRRLELEHHFDSDRRPSLVIEF